MPRDKQSTNNPVSAEAVSQVQELFLFLLLFNNNNKVIIIIIHVEQSQTKGVGKTG